MNQQQANLRFEFVKATGRMLGERHTEDSVAYVEWLESQLAAERALRQTAEQQLADCIARANIKVERIQQLKRERDAMRAALRDLMDCIDNNPPYVDEAMDRARAALAGTPEPATGAKEK